MKKTVLVLGFLSQISAFASSELDWLAHFDHRVVGEGLPCITGGACSDVLNPGNLIDPKEKISVAPIRVILSERLLMDQEKKTCQRILEETVKGLVRGKIFQHFRYDSLKDVDFEKCEKVAGV